MDPNACLKELLSLVDSIEKTEVYEAEDPDGSLGWHRDIPQLYYDSGRLCELVKALNGWLINGGPLPKNWSRRRTG